MSVKTTSFITLDSSNPLYPQSLKTIDAPPKQLFVSGEIACLSKPCLAIVGTRKPTSFAQKMTERWAKMLADAGMVVVSGLALGIDGAAHRGALLGAAKTIAVLGCGLHHDYPKQHAELRSAIIDQGGCVISEYRPETPPRPPLFPRRNRIISGLSEGVLVMEAALRSGSLVTARLAVEQGKEVMAVPGSLHNPMTTGCHWLIREGATLVTSVEEVAECLKNSIGPFSQGEKNAVEEPMKILLPKEELSILEHIRECVTPIDEIVANSQLAFHDVCSILVRLEISGHIEKVAGGYRLNGL